MVFKDIGEFSVKWVQILDENGKAECPESGQKYRLTGSGNAQVVKIDENK